MGYAGCRVRAERGERMLGVSVLGRSQGDLKAGPESIRKS